MNTEKNALNKLKKMGKGYDGYFSSLNDANKVSDKSYGSIRHIRYCITFLLDFVKAQNTIIRYFFFFVSFGIPGLYGYLIRKGNPIVESIPYSYVVFVAIMGLMVLFWWLDRSTLLKVTEPTDKLFHIGAYEKIKNKEYKRNYDFFQNEPLSFEEISKEIQEEIKKVKEERKVEEEFYMKKLEEKDDLLMRSIKDLQEINRIANEYSVKNYKMDKIFQEVMIKIPRVLNSELTLNDLDFHYYFTVHRIDAKEYSLVAIKHPHYHKLAINYSKKGNNHLLKTETKKDGFLAIKEKHISFVMAGENNEKLIVTLYPKTKPLEAVQFEEDYDILYIEDIISLWKSFTPLIYSMSNKPIESKGEVTNEEKSKVQ